MPANFSGLTIWFSPFPETQDCLKNVDNYGYWCLLLQITGTVSDEFYRIPVDLDRMDFSQGQDKVTHFLMCRARNQKVRGYFSRSPELGLWYALCLLGRQGTDSRQEHPCLEGLCCRHLIWTSQGPLLSLSVWEENGCSYFLLGRG